MGVRRMGAEEEFLLVDPRDGKPAPVAARLLGPTGGTRDPDLESELQLQQVETATEPCTTVEDLLADLRTKRAHGAQVAEANGVRLAALATSPLPVHATIFPSPRYRTVAERFGMTALEQLTCGCHIHVEVQSDEEGVAVLDRIRPWTSVLLALSANSPFWQGEDTRYASYRSQVWGRWPTAHPIAPFGSATAYHRMIEEMVATDTILDPGMVYFDARLSSRYPTVEIRVTDVCLNGADVALLAALARALVDTAAEHWRSGAEVDAVRAETLALARWRACRSGLAGRLVHPVTRRPAPATEVVRCLVEHVSDSLDETGDRDIVRELLDELFVRGTGADQQRADLAETGDLVRVVTRAVRRTIAAGP